MIRPVTGPAVPSAHGANAPSRFADALERALRSGRPSAADLSTQDPRELLELQASLYRDAQRLELASRAVDHAVGALKTLLQTRM